MNFFKFFSVLALALAFTACSAQSESSDQTAYLTDSKVEILNFHSTHRCMTCNAIEASTKYTLNTYFADQLKDGTISLQVINVDEEANESIAEKFEAYGTALYLNIIKGGEEKRVNLTDFAFANGNEQATFAKELKVKLDAELKTL